MLKRRFKRLVSLAASLCTITLFVVNLRHPHKKQKPWGMLLTRGLNIRDTHGVDINQPDFELSSLLPLDEVALEAGALLEDSILYDDATLGYEDDMDDASLVKRNDDDIDEEEEGDYNDNEMTRAAESREPPASEVEESEDGQYSPLPEWKDYREVFSLTSGDRNFFPIYLGGDVAYNPSIIPHPTRHDLWIIIAQREQSSKDMDNEEALTCTAGFLNGVLVCTAPPTVLPVTKSIHGKCEGKIAYFNLRGGPRDARIFYGPDAPYILYGSQASYTCLGIWLQDLRMLLQDFRLEQMTLVKLFKRTTEVQRPSPVKEIEKNFFLFWDSDNKAYVHHDIYPSRVFAQLSYDGSVGPDLAPNTATKDGICMAKYMPTLESSQETIHQATNSLSITMCARKDPFCVPSDANTFIITIFQQKSYYDYHSIYEPYVFLFRRTAPFSIHAISQRPLWIHGRRQLSPESHAIMYDQHPDRRIPEGHSEMFYITSMSWKTHGQRYHGFIDDVLFLSFGVEDSRSGVVDVVAGDLVQDLGFCSR